MTSEEILPDLDEYSEEINYAQCSPADIQEEEEVETTENLINIAADEEQIHADGEDQHKSRENDITETTNNKTNNNKDKSTEKSEKNEPRATQLPMSRVRNLMKLDSDLQIASNEAVYLVAKATEYFIDSLAKESFVHTAQAKKKTIQKRDVDIAIASVDSLMFLEGAMNF